MRQSDGNAKAVPPVKFLPANSKVSAINISGTIVYAATVDGCGGNPNALYAVDLGGAEQHVVSFPTNGSGLSGKGGTAIAENGTVYAQVDSGHGDVAGDYNRHRPRFESRRPESEGLFHALRIGACRREKPLRRRA